MNLPDSLMEQVKRRAENDRRTVTSLVEQALRELLSRDDFANEEEDVLPTYGAPGSHRLVDIDDKDALYEALDAGLPG
jgi:hypothetical protein